MTRVPFEANASAFEIIDDSTRTVSQPNGNTTAGASCTVGGTGSSIRMRDVGYNVKYAPTVAATAPPSANSKRV